MSPIPTVVVGRSPDIARAVREGLLPEYEVIHVALSVEQAVKDLPLLLSTPPKAPQNTENNVGSRNYDERPVAVLTGGGINDTMFNEIKEACKDVDKGIVWGRADVSKVGDMPNLSDTDAYGAETARRVKKKLVELGVGTDKEVKTDVYFF